MNTLMALLSGPSGKTSTMRVSCLAVVMTVMGTWSWVSIAKEQLQLIPESVAAILIASLVTKAAQRKIETGNSTLPAP